MRKITLTHFIKAPVEKVRGFFTDLSRFGEVHPLITEVETINENEAVFFESTKILGLIPHKLSYRAKMTEDGDSVKMSAEPKPGIKLELKFIFFETENQTRITEEIEIGAFFPVAYILKKEIVRSHHKLAENIRSALS